MNVKFLASRTPDRAEIWFVDVMGALVTAVLFGLGGGALFAGDQVPWWAPLIAVLVGSCWTTRIRITREQPTEATLTTFWVIVPVRRLWGMTRSNTPVGARSYVRARVTRMQPKPMGAP